MRQEERTLITRYRSGRRGKPDPDGGSFRFLRCPPVGWLSDTVWERSDGSDSPAIGSAEKGIGRRSTAIAWCRSLILNSFASDFELAVFQPRRRLRRNDMGDSPLFWKKSVTAGVAAHSGNVTCVRRDTRDFASRDPKRVLRDVRRLNEIPEGTIRLV